MEFTADLTERLDKFLATASGVSRGRVQTVIKSGTVKVNNEPITETDFKVAVGDVVTLPEFEDQSLTPKHLDLKIVYENDDVLVIDKPAGLMVHPGAGRNDDTLSHALLSYYPQIKDVGEPHRPGIVHRLDEDTSGLILVAKNQAAYDYFKKQFAERNVKKQYLALVHGVPEKIHDIINLPLTQNFHRRRMKVGEGEGKEAVTEYSIIAENSKADGLDQMALLRVNLHTGRTHQIRVHLSHINHPIVGDQTYGGAYKESDQQILGRQFLHAYSLKFQMMDGTWIELTSPLPHELQETLNKYKITYDPSI